MRINVANDEMLGRTTEKLQREIDLHCDFNNYLLEKIEKAGKEIERLTKQNEALNEMYELTKKEYIRLNNIINKIREYVYKPIDKEWDDILCIIEDGLKGSDKE